MSRIEGHGTRGGAQPGVPSSLASVEVARDRLRTAQLELDAAWPSNPLDEKGWTDLRSAMAAFRDAADAFQTALFEQLRRDSRETAQTTREKERAAEEAHEKELYHLLALDDEYRRGIEVVARYEKEVESIHRLERTTESSKDRELEVAYERMLASWKSHVEKLALDRIELIAQEQASNRKKHAVWAVQDSAEAASDDALAVYLQGLISQAAASGDPVSISAPASAESGDGASRGSALVTTLVAAMSTADDGGAVRQRLRSAMSEQDFFGMLDNLFTPAARPKLGG